MSRTQTKLKDHIEVKKGSYITKKDAIPGPYPVILGGREPAYHIDRFNHEGEAIVVSRSGASAGYVSFWNEPIFITDGFLIEGKPDIDYHFLYYLMKSKQNELNGLQRGAAIPHVTPSLINDVDVYVPSIEKQRSIASILMAYDNLIENNRRQIALLEEAAQRLYKEWFVDLRFPGYEGVVKSDGLPDGWTEATLADIADVVMGQSPKSEYYNDTGEGLPFHQGVSSYGLRFVRDETYTTSVTRIGRAGSILFSVRAPVGRLNYTKNEIVLGRGLAAMNHKQGLQSYLYYMLKERFFKEDMIGNGSIFASISKGDLLAQKFVVPDGQLAERFNALCRPIDKQIERCDDTIKVATEARDRLLPKLMSGEIKAEG